MAKRWYVVHTYSGYENKVKNDLEHRIETYGLENVVVDIKIPTEEVTEIKDGGKRETKESKVFPGYVLVRMEMDDNSWSVVRNTPGVTVRVLSGPLADFDAQVTEVNAEAGKVKVVMMIFGRETPAELTLDQVSVIA